MKDMQATPIAKSNDNPARRLRSMFSTNHTQGSNKRNKNIDTGENINALLLTRWNDHRLMFNEPFNKNDLMYPKYSTIGWYSVVWF